MIWLKHFNNCLQSNHGGLKQKSDIENYRNKLRQKARRKGYGEFSLSESGNHGYSHRDSRLTRHENSVKEPMTAEEKRASFAGCHKRYASPHGVRYAQLLWSVWDYLDEWTVFKCATVGKYCLFHLLSSLSEVHVNWYFFCFNMFIQKSQALFKASR